MKSLNLYKVVSGLKISLANKTVLLLLSFCLFGVNGFAQTPFALVPGQSQSMYENTGFIGIGTTAPSSNLSIYTTENPGTGYYPAAGLDVLNSAPFYSTESGGFTPISLRVSRFSQGGQLGDITVPDATTTDFIVTEKGYVGIGTATPQTNLDVNGSANVSQNVSIAGYTLIGGYAAITGYATIGGNATVAGNATIGGNATISNNALVSGNVGIGTTSPQAALDVHGNAIINGLSNPAMLTLKSTSNGWANQIEFRDASALRHVIADDAGTGELVFHPGYTTTSGAVSKVRVEGSLHVEGQSNLDNYVQIGSQKPTGTTFSSANLLLSVYGDVVCRRVYVETSNWADKVFDAHYPLNSLNDVESYIKENKHLPEIPSECEAIEKGVDVGEMNKLLLQKVEELTLYTIQLHKDIELLKLKK